MKERRLLFLSIALFVIALIQLWLFDSEQKWISTALLIVSLLGIVYYSVLLLINKNKGKMS